MGDEIHRVIAGHVLFLQEIGGVAFAFGEDGHQNIGARHLGAARALDVDRRALDNALEGCCRHRLGPVDICHQIGQVFVDEFDQGAAQFFQIDAAGFHHPDCIGFFQQCQKQVFQRREFMAPLIRSRQGRVNGLF